MTEWDETFRKFRHVAACEGVRRIAAEVPVDPSNLYKLLRGDTKNPTRAVRAGIERVVKEHEQDKPQ